MLRLMTNQFYMVVRQEKCKNELIERLKPGGYLHTTFGEDGQNAEECDFVVIMLTIGKSI